ncbi:hypothetical protein Tsubulata_009085 [Turnera subulata]|uniref:Helicase C-terminal domain-containing protein n=1 Tax=Turnera subulata TaxID=218843 RepID=A0A9Q0JG66_9ROSI|nr:hypothetical protein Tsubulata_009085 [Turnera subulata]
MPVTEEQRQRAEANRLAALEKRKAYTSSITTNHQQEQQEQDQNPWRLFKCRKLSPEQTHPSKPPPFRQVVPESDTLLAGKFRARLEICAPDKFSITPEAMKGFAYHGEDECLRMLEVCLSEVMSSRYTQVHGGRTACVYELRDYDAVLTCLKNYKCIEIQKVPFTTLNVIQRLSHSHDMGRWEPCRPEHLTEEKVDELTGKLPKKLVDSLLPFQLEGLRFGLRRGGRCLIADEMGLGKTLQAIAIAGCFIDEGPVLVVCPAILRFSWAEELERWLPFCLPSEIHLGDHRPYDIFHQINVLWPGLLGQDKYEFAKSYCAARYVRTSEGKCFQDFSRGVRLEELNVLLRQTVMIRRLKEHVLKQLPPKRRQIIRLLLKKSDIISAKSAMRLANGNASGGNAVEASNPENFLEPDDSSDCCTSRQLSNQELGIAKLHGFREWLSIHPVILEPDGEEELDVNPSSQKMIIFAHHHKVLDGVQEFICEKGVGFVRIDGTTLARDRQIAVQSFQSSDKVKIAIIGITAGGVGLDFSSARNVVFLELPQSPSLMLQAEDRAHRRGQTNAVNIYIFCAKDTIDEGHWQTLNKCLHRVSSTTNGKYDAVSEIAVEGISYLETFGRMKRKSEDLVSKGDLCGELPTVEIVKLQESGLELDSQSFEGKHEETAGRSIEGSRLTGGRIPADDQPGIFFDQGAGKALVADENQAGDVSKSETSQSTISSSNLDEGNGAKVQLEKENKISLETTGEDGLIQLSGDEYLSEQVYSLRFEVSKYTERVHLYSCSLGTESRPQPLYVNFRLEELESLGSPAGNDSKEVASKFLNDNPAYRAALLAFLHEWNSLRPVDKRKLREKTLQLPLSVELCCLNESVNHNSRGVLKNGSKRRTTPLYEISHPLPSNAVLKMVHLSFGHGKKEKQFAQGWTLLDEPLCKLCQTPCMGKNAKMPEYFEDLFCSLDCYEEYRIRTSSRFLRQELFQLEHGICRNCQLDCHALVKTIKPLSLDRRREYVKKVAPNVASRAKLLDKLVTDPSEGNAWHADHIIPVYRGGGECRLENMRTLCVACHSDVTAAQRSERRLARARARKQLEVIINDLKYGHFVEEAENKVQGHSQMPEESIEDELLVKVPGSAYSSAKDSFPAS